MLRLEYGFAMLRKWKKSIWLLDIIGAGGARMDLAVILSGGVGSRLKGIGIPKQYYNVCGRTVLSYCLERTAKVECVDAYIIVAAADWQEFILQEMDCLLQLGIDYQSKFLGFALPGENRQLSILNGLHALSGQAGEKDIVLVQDAVRPLTSGQLIQKCMDAAKGAQGAMPVLRMTDTVYYSKDGKKVDALLDRDRIIAGQAPEAFAYGPYLKANEDLTEMEMLAVRGSTEPAIKAGMEIALVDGEERNFKITTAQDLEQFKRIMEDNGHESLHIKRDWGFGI